MPSSTLSVPVDPSCAPTTPWTKWLLKEAALVCQSSHYGRLWDSFKSCAQIKQYS